MKLRNLQNGQTLIELLLYIGISSIILLVTSLFLSTLLQSRIKNQTVSEVDQQGLAVMQIITQTLRNADIILSPAPNKSTSTLAVNTVLSANNPTIFALSGSSVSIKEGTSTAISLTNSRVIASDLTFANLSNSRVKTPGVISVQFSLTHVNPSGGNEYSFTKTFEGSAALRP